MKKLPTVPEKGTLTRYLRPVIELNQQKSKTMKKIIQLLPCLALTLFSCSEDVEFTQAEVESKALTVRTEIAGSSRSMITDTHFPDGSSLGVTLVENKDGVLSYDGLTEGYYNVQYRSRGIYPDQVWTAVDKPIYLSATDGRAIAYYPWDEDEDDFTSLPLLANGQTDYMYSDWAKPINNLNSNALFNMKHAMAGIRISLVRGSYTGRGSVSVIRLSSTALGVEGTLNASTGAITDVRTGEINTYMMQPVFQSFTVTDDYTDTLLMGVPVPGQKDDVLITVEVDGHVYQIKGLMTQSFASGNMYTFKLTLDNTALSISEEVVITDWIEDTTASTENGGVLSPVIPNP